MFSPEWLTLREPADFGARSATLTRAVADVLDPRVPLRALDLAGGTGANVRYLAGHVSGTQEWLLVDHDPALLSHVRERMSAWALGRGGDVSQEDRALTVRVGSATYVVDIRQSDLRTLDAAVFAGRTLITASALLDLVSGSWMRALAARCREAGAAALFALTYDGRMSCSPAEPEDERIRALVNAHQLTDKGFGPALGPDAVETAATCFADLGYHIRRERSDWVLGSGSHDLQRHLIDGWVEAAKALAPGEATSILSWRTRRLAHVEHRRSQLIVGHEDLAAWPASARP